MSTLESDGPFDVYIARPDAGTAVKGALVVIEEIWGLQPHILDIAERFAALGYVVASPDLMGRTGLHPKLGEELENARFSDDLEVKSALQPRLREAFAGSRAPEFKDWAVGALRATVDFLDAQPGVDGRIGVLGYCFGGTYSFALAASDDRVKVAIPYYGAPPELDEVQNIRCPVLAFYGEEDERLISGLPEVTAAMKKAGVDFTTKVYEGTGHAFFNDSNPHTYDAAAATESWSLTLQALDRALV